MGYNRENYEAAKAVLADRRARAMAEAESRRASLHLSCPAIGEIDAALARHSMQLFGIACLTEGAEKTRQMEALKRENQELQEARAHLLTEQGLPVTYTDPVFTCPACKDTGIGEGGRMCACLKRELTLLGLRSSGLGALAERQSFDTFSLDFCKSAEQRQRTEANLAATRRYAETFTREAGNLLMIGHTGLGKTHLSTSIARAVIERGYDVVYESAPNLMADFSTDQFQPERGAAPKGERYLSAELLIIDDLGTEFPTSFHQSALYNLLNTRINRRLPTVINTNLTPTALRERYDDRIASRLLGEYRVLLFVGEDVRYQKLS